MKDLSCIACCIADVLSVATVGRGKEGEATGGRGEVGTGGREREAGEEEEDAGKGEDRTIAFSFLTTTCGEAAR